MTTEINYLEINKQSWNDSVAVHLKSGFYDVDGFIKGSTSLKEIELKLLGDIRGKSILHLQCHFGQDTISLSRMGANVTGIDLSDKAIESAKELSKKVNTDTSFICCDLYDLPKNLEKQFDIVFTSYGTIGWLPDLDKWGKIISAYLKPGGKLIFVEFHPVVWMFDDSFDKIGYSYFNAGPITETETGTYADRKASITQQYVCWNHGISEVVNSLIKNGLEINSFDEFDYSPYNCFKETIEFEPGKYRIKHLENKIPMVYALSATKKNS
ncbi:MAG TPA: class I SAM-dependent methyltransferase [Bacteroidia bacterium]|nr:class I SAM-dependent methyltransferase [Bacteroidia bacterium]